MTLVPRKDVERRRARIILGNKINDNGAKTTVGGARQCGFVDGVCSVVILGDVDEKRNSINQQTPLGVIRGPWEDIGVICVKMPICEA